MRCEATESADGAIMENVAPPPRKARARRARQSAPGARHRFAAQAHLEKGPHRDRLHVNGECKQNSEGAAKAGLARESLSRALSQPHIAEHSLSANSSIQGAVTAQACTNQICLLPSTLPISTAVGAK
jgi:hypothetical protein